MNDATLAVIVAALLAIGLLAAGKGPNVERAVNTGAAVVVGLAGIAIAVGLLGLGIMAQR